MTFRPNPSALAEIRDICAALNAAAPSLAPMLLPNGVRDGRHWKTSSVDDVKTGRYSLVCDLDGPDCGQWKDFGGHRAGEGHGDMLDLVRIVKCGGDKTAAIGWARSYLGISAGDGRQFEKLRAEGQRRAAVRDEEAAAEAARKRDKAKGLWLRGIPLSDRQSAPAVDYLYSRGIDIRKLGKAPGALRYLDACFNGEAGKPLPAMVATILALDGQQLGTHRTWIAQVQGAWAKHPRLADAKKTYGPSLGGHIPLWKGVHDCTLREIPAGTDVYVSEGIEDGLSIAMADPSRRVIAAVSLSKLGALQLPAEIGQLVVIGQNDGKAAKAVDSLEVGVGALQARGVKVAIIYPPAPYKDFNEWLQRDPAGFFGRPAEGRAA